ncbi:MAG TPA: HAD family hydrolase [Nitrospirales bacterium]|nr:HAD family hydrolase [Nitrospirales bacterium]HIA13671.1 HAD family hydrolase [Nitrospirales bacterium]HIB54040.1 HAD family hydrolase [Nitrospirales bacterium]HIC04358.1 HAD family hydrolase [Nitrospirales bacterium]HIN33905.1 HAD family hydrolase [Nitrospirales bacterium]
MAIKTIFLDAGGTLIKVKGTVGEVYATTAKRHGFHIDPGHINGAFRQAFDKAPPLAFPGTPDDQLLEKEKAWWMGVVQDVFGVIGIDRTDERFPALFQDLFHAFEGSDEWELYPEVIEVLEEFEKREIPLGIISNFDSRLTQICEDLQIANFFTSITISSREGAAKPDSAIFRKALAKHQIEPHEAIHIGDSLRDDIEGATKVGLHTLHLDRENQSNNQNNHRVIPTLRELLSHPTVLAYSASET